MLAGILIGLAGLAIWVGFAVRESGQQMRELPHLPSEERRRALIRRGVRMAVSGVMLYIIGMRTTALSPSTFALAGATGLWVFRAGIAFAAITFVVVCLRVLVFEK